MHSPQLRLRYRPGEYRTFQGFLCLSFLVPAALLLFVAVFGPVSVALLAVVLLVVLVALPAATLVALFAAAMVLAAAAVLAAVDLLELRERPIASH